MLSFASPELHSCKPQVTCESENFHNVNKARRTNEEAASKIHGCRPMRRPAATSKQQKNIYKRASAQNTAGVMTAFAVYFKINYVNFKH